MNSTRKALPIACLLTAMVLWSSSFIALKYTFVFFDAMVVIFGRMLVGSICFLFLIPHFGQIKYQPGDLRLLLAMAFFEPCLYFLFEAKAIEQTTASQAGMVTAILPLMVAISAYFILNEKITRRTFFGFFIAVMGVILLSWAAEKSAYAPNPLLGNFLEFMAMACATGYILLLKVLSVRYSPLFLTGLQSFVGMFFYFPILFLPGIEIPSQFDVNATLAVIYLGSFVTIGAYGLYNYALSKVSANQSAIYINLIPAFSLILGWLVMGETLNIIQILAVCVIFCGVFLSQSLL